MQASHGDIGYLLNWIGLVIMINVCIVHLARIPCGFSSLYSDNEVGAQGRRRGPCFGAAPPSLPLPSPSRRTQPSLALVGGLLPRRFLGLLLELDHRKRGGKGPVQVHVLVLAVSVHVHHHGQCIGLGHLQQRREHVLGLFVREPVKGMRQGRNAPLQQVHGRCDQVTALVICGVGVQQVRVVADVVGLLEVEERLHSVVEHVPGGAEGRAVDPL
mmetsp:Transcript_94873/g.163705  ORF Transcript_94873/g.163705 Transcript_94873/m.163705 type:complete len:215 (-) Transcript_94873:287-931(-)